MIPGPGLDVEGFASLAGAFSFRHTTGWREFATNRAWFAATIL
jgi:hypothetical protein